MTQLQLYITEVTVLCLVSGVLLGLLFLAMKILKLALRIGKIGEAVLDILFWAVAAVVFFLLSLAISGGQLRFVQTALCLIGLFAVLLIFDPFIDLISNKVNIILTKIFSFIKRRMQFFSRKKRKRKSQNKSKKDKKAKKKKN